MAPLEVLLWLAFILTVVGLWISGFWLIVRGTQQYLLSKPIALTRSLIGRGAALVFLGSATAEILAIIVR